MRAAGGPDPGAGASPGSRRPGCMAVNWWAVVRVLRNFRRANVFGGTDLAMVVCQPCGARGGDDGGHYHRGRTGGDVPGGERGQPDDQRTRGDDHTVHPGSMRTVLDGFTGVPANGA